MNAMQELESMGYRFTLDGDRVRYELYGGEAPARAAELLAELDRNVVYSVLMARKMGYTVVKPQIVHVSRVDRDRYFAMIAAAHNNGEFASVRVTYIRPTGETIYELMPPGVDFMKYEGGIV